jgi:hypothetical protein
MRNKFPMRFSLKIYVNVFLIISGFFLSGMNIKSDWILSLLFGGAGYMSLANLINMVDDGIHGS